jgi:carboxypeptidase C (cathepsin A)
VDAGKASPFDEFDYAQVITRHLRENDAARIFIGTGIYDTLTTVGAAELLVASNDLPRERVSMHRYEGGHMMYSDQGSAGKLANDLRCFVTSR